MGKTESTRSALLVKPSRAQDARLQQGRRQRKSLSRSKLGEMTANRRHIKPLDVLLSATDGRLEKLLPLKYGRMCASPFAFFRGAVSIMAADLAKQPNTGIMVQLCGDAHVQNLGCYEGPDGRLIFDINDFDETISGPWEWDVKRMATSIMLAGRESNHSRAECIGAVEEFIESYQATVGQLADEPILVAARFQIRRTQKAQAVSAALSQARRANPLDLRAKYTITSGSRMYFKRIENLLWRVQGAERQQVLDGLELYRESLGEEQLHLFSFFVPVDVAFKVVGTGSVGLRDYVILMAGNGPEDPLFLQIKQEVDSIYAAYLKSSGYANQGRRVAEGQRKIQPLSDLLLGWTRIGEQDYLVRQLNDHKGSIDLKQLRGDGLNSLAIVAGELLGRGHSRSGDSLVIKSYIGSGDKVLKSLVHFAIEYANVTEVDFESFTRAIREGRIKIRH
ncbi:MAG TPA: DUF2252 domain-containing protein [Pyrinomonadaceae bacterium]